MPPYRPSRPHPTARRSFRHRKGRLAVLWLPTLLLLAIAGLAISALARQFFLGGGAGYPAPEGMAEFFLPSVRRWGGQIETWSDQWGLDINLVATLIQIESCGDPQANSQAGALGLFQVMPFHFKPGEDPLDPETNAKRGLHYFRQSLDAADGDVRQALAGYNGGISLVGSPEEAWPDETSQYVVWGEGIFQEAAAGKTRSETLNAWLRAGGARLCAQARLRLGLQP